MKCSESIKEIATALNKVQAILTPAQMKSSNPYFSSKYADLTEIWETIRKAIGDNGISVVQSPAAVYEAGQANVMLTTRVMHTSGEWIESTLILKPAKSDPQGIGSAITYGRRYALAALIGVSAEEDDDGNNASTPGQTTTPPKSNPPASTTKPAGNSQRQTPPPAQTQAGAKTPTYKDKLLEFEGDKEAAEMIWGITKSMGLDTKEYKDFTEAEATKVVNQYYLVRNKK